MLERELVRALRRFPVVALLGPRQAGKTTLAMMLQKAPSRDCVYVDLELPSDQAKLVDPEYYLRAHAKKLVILDEIQRLPMIFTVLRALVDEERRPGRFLILGSASGDLLRQSAESLAGRIDYHELTPFLLPEVTTGARGSSETVHRHWLRGGYPLSYLAGSIDSSRAWRRSFIRTYLERDIPQLGINVPAALLGRFWEMIAHWNGQLWNASVLASSLGISAPTVRRYLDILSSTFIVRQLQPLQRSTKKRLVKAPKVYLRDTGMLHEILRIADLDSLLGHPGAGASWEGFVVEQTLSLLPRDWAASFYRSHAGAELDLVLERPGKKPIGVEIKLSTSPRLTAGTHRAFEDTGCERGYVVIPPRGKHSDAAFPLGPRFTALSLPLWIEELKKLGRSRGR